MYKIILVGSKNDSTITSALLKMFSDYGSTILINDGKLKESKNSNIGANFILYDTDNLSKCNAEDTIIIIKDQVDIERILFEKIKANIIVSSSNETVISELKNRGIKFITCGMAENDTVSYSSITDESIVFLLQKKIPRLNGKSTEAMEIPLKIQNTNTYYLMSFFACMVLCNMDGHLLDK